jgi:hypothetical protein
VSFVPQDLARRPIERGELRVVATLDPSSVTVHAVHHDPAPELVRRAVSALVERAAAATAAG